LHDKKLKGFATMTDRNKSPLDIEWEQRTLCSDESCIGVIGKNGLCKECGQPYEGTLPWLAVSTSSNSTDVVMDSSIEVEETESPAEAEIETSADGEGFIEDPDLEWERRILCSDESCIGVIGVDGKCKECGKPYEGNLPWLKQDDSPKQTDTGTTLDNDLEE
jgi:hypothetical protein